MNLRASWFAALAGFAACAASVAPASTPTQTELIRVRVAAISFVPEKLGLEANAARLERLFREAAAGGAKLAVAPEGALDGYLINPILAGEIPVERMREVAIPIDHPVIERFRALAKSLALCLVFGFAEQIGADVSNTAVFIDHAGAIRGKYHKMLFEEGYHPDWWFNRIGAQSRAFDTPFGRCGVLICNDRWNPALAKIPALDGAQFLVIPAYGSTGASQDEAVLSRGRETGLPVVEANVGVSLIVSDGNIAAVQRAREGVTFGAIEIPARREAKPAERDAAEREFLEWRAGEMETRYERKMQRIAGARK